MSNVTIVIKHPIWSANTGALVSDSLAEKVSQYSQEVKAVGGYWSASFEFEATQSEAEQWFQNGVGYDVSVYSPELSKIWEGFIDRVSVSIGSLSATRGDLVNITNRTKAEYKTVTYNTNPPIGGGSATTSTANNTDSQGKYGILESVISGGEGSLSQMENIRDVFLADSAEPETSRELSANGGGSAKVSIECLGYVHLLNRYYVTDTNTGTSTLSAKIQTVLGADPSARFSANYDNIDTNSETTGTAEDGKRTAWAIIQELVAVGDGTNRWTFGVYEDRKAYYRQIPSTIDYSFSLSDSRQDVFNQQGGIVQKYSVKAGRWVFVSDFMAGFIAPSGLRNDPRNVFIESAVYSTPNSLSIKGGKVDTISQIMARKGL